MKIIQVPKCCQTKIVHLPKDGLDGIKLTRNKLIWFSKVAGTVHIDEIIPLGKDSQPHPDSCPVQHESADMPEHQVYWSVTGGGHGWCCDTCGKVVQWG